MKQSTVDYIKDLCLNKKLSQGNNMARAQVMLRNIKFFEAHREHPVRGTREMPEGDGQEVRRDGRQHLGYH